MNVHSSQSLGIHQNLNLLLNIRRSAFGEIGKGAKVKTSLQRKKDSLIASPKNPSAGHSTGATQSSLSSGSRSVGSISSCANLKKETGDAMKLRKSLMRVSPKS